MSKIFSLFLIIPAALFTGCSHSIILLSPADHYELGNYYLSKGKSRQASEQFEIIKDKYPLSDYATMSQFKLAQTLYARKKYEEAAVDFEIFVEFHPAHKLAPEALYYLAMSKYESMLHPERDPTMAREAKASFKRFLALYPEHPKAEEAAKHLEKVENHLLEHELQVGLVYYRRAVYKAAVNRIEPVTRNAHDPVLKAHAEYILGRCRQKQNEIDKARHHYTETIIAAPDSKWASKAKKQLKKLPDNSGQSTE